MLAEPDGAVDFTLSDIALEFAAEAGYVLDEWQQWLVRMTFARRADGLWAARDVGAEVPRQNGKNIWLEIVELVSLLLFGDRLITHSAHRADTSHEHFVSLKERIESSEFLMEQMPHRANNGFVTSHGLESIEFLNGARLQFKARMTSSGRGPRPQKVVFDEALVLTHDRVGSMAPGVSAQRNPQLIFASSSPRADSEVLHELRKRALDPEPGERLFYAAWNNPPGTDLEDRDAWYRVNPSLGMGRLTEESLNANRRMMVEAEYIREHLGVPELALELDQAIPAEIWANCIDPDSQIKANDCWAVVVTPDRKWSCIAVAGRNRHGKLHVESLHRQAGTWWVLDRLVSIWREKKIPLRIHKSGPEASFIAPLREAGVELVEVTSADVAQATGQLIDAANADELRHLDQPTLNKALAGAVLRTSSDGASLWSQRNSSVEISPLMAVTVAAGGVPVEQVRPPQVWSWSLVDAGAR